MLKKAIKRITKVYLAHNLFHCSENKLQVDYQYIGELLHNSLLISRRFLIGFRSGKSRKLLHLIALMPANVQEEGATSFLVGPCFTGGHLRAVKKFLS